MWTPATRRQHSRIVTRYQTDLTDAEWRVIAPPLPKLSATGRPREWPMREIVNGIFYVTRAGCPWRLPPNDLPGTDVVPPAPAPANSVTVTRLRIPYGNKEVALKLGARYGSVGWYAPPGVDLSAFGERGWL